MSWFAPKLARGESILLRRGAFVSVTGLSGVVVLFATGFALANGAERWPVAETAVMGLALAALPVAFILSGVRMRLEPGETRPIRPRSQDDRVARIFGLCAIPFLSLSVGSLLRLILSEGGSSLASSEIELSGLQVSVATLVGIGAGLAFFLGFRSFWIFALNSLGVLFLTNRRAIRFTPGFWSGRIEILALADVVEIRESPSGITLIAASPEAICRLRPDGSTEPAGIDRFNLPLMRFRPPGTAASQYDRAVTLLGRKPLRWQAPSLPPAVERLVSLNAKFPNIVAVLAGMPMSALLIAVAVRPDTLQGYSHDWLAGAGLISMLVLIGLAAIGYCLFLWLAARRLTAEDAALFLRASFHPDWAPGKWPRTPYIAARHAALKRRQRMASWLAGRPVPFENGPGPEAFGGGWRE